MDTLHTARWGVAASFCALRKQVTEESSVSAGGRYNYRAFPRLSATFEVGSTGHELIHWQILWRCSENVSPSSGQQRWPPQNGPDKTQKGALICIRFGCNVPVVLRGLRMERLLCSLVNASLTSTCLEKKQEAVDFRRGDPVFRRARSWMLPLSLCTTPTHLWMLLSNISISFE